jgi:hypothetical protein
MRVSMTETSRLQIETKIQADLKYPQAGDRTEKSSGVTVGKAHRCLFSEPWFSHIQRRS